MRLIPALMSIFVHTTQGWCVQYSVPPFTDTLYNSVLLGVDAAAQFVHFTGRNFKLLAQAAGNGAVFKPGRRAVIAGSHNLPVFYNYGAYTAAQTGAALAYHAVRPCIHTHFVPKIRSPASPSPGTM